jgi:hypothetical protein
VGALSRSFAVPIVIGVLLIGALVLRAHPGAVAGSQGRQVGEISAAERAATFTFDPAVAEADRTVFLRAVAAARPEARRLIAAVDGLVDVHVVVTESGTVGVTQSHGDRYDVSVNLGLVSRRYGRRGIDRTVLHELGHVVDFALVSPDVDQALDAAIPAGYGCDQAQMGSCASPVERFAESFAKWATGDIGVDMYLGYKVPPPDDVDAWGAPLASLAGSS